MSFGVFFGLGRPARVLLLNLRMPLLLRCCVLSIVLLFVIPSTIGVAKPKTGNAPTIGQLAPDFELEARDGSRLKLSSLRGKVVVLNFWAQWCGPCLNELPLLDAMHLRLVEPGALVLGVNIDEQISAGRGVADHLGLNMSVVFDPKGDAVALYDPPALPTTYLIDAEGKLVEIYEGELDADKLKVIETCVLALLGSEAKP